MKTKISFALSAIVLLTALTSCGGSGNNNNNLANNGNFDAYYNQCLYDQNCYNTLFGNQFGQNNTYFTGYQNYGGYPCQTYSVPYYNGFGGYGSQQFGIAPPGAVIPQYGINGTGGAFSIGFGANFGWN